MKKELKNTLENLTENKIILYPSDTVWGIGCDATNEIAVAKIFKIKKRNESKSLVILVHSLQMLRQYVDKIPESIIDALGKFGKPTTVIYNNPKKIAKNLIPKDNTIAIRIVQDKFCKKLIKEFGKPIVSTSANVSGQATPKSFKEISSAILKGVDYVVNLHHEKTCNKPSSIIKLSNNGVVKVIRE